jgi:hypothetical protein
MREAARIERDILLDALQEEAVATTSEGEADAAAHSATETAALAAAAEADAARRADLQDRLEEAERQVAIERQRRLDAGEPLVAAEVTHPMTRADEEPDAEPVEPPKRSRSRRKKVVVEAPVEVPVEQPVQAPPVVSEPAAQAPAPAAAPPTQRRVAAQAPVNEEERIFRALELRDRARAIIATADRENLAAELAVLSRLEQEYDLRAIAAALLRELGAPATQTAPLVPAAVAASTPMPERAQRSTATESVVPPPSIEDDGDEMTRLFISIGRRARVTREKLQQLLTETAGIELDDIGRIDLLHNFAFIEVRKQVAGRVVESMHDTMFRGREISVEPATAREADGDTDADEASPED